MNGDTKVFIEIKSTSSGSKDVSYCIYAWDDLAMYVQYVNVTKV